MHQSCRNRNSDMKISRKRINCTMEFSVVGLHKKEKPGIRLQQTFWCLRERAEVGPSRKPHRNNPMEECKSEAVARLSERERSALSHSARGCQCGSRYPRIDRARASLKSKHKIHAHTWLRFEAADARDWKTFRPAAEILPCTFAASVPENPAKNGRCQNLIF